MNLYRERHHRSGERLLIEETAQAIIGALGNLFGYAFRDSWTRLQDELALSRDRRSLRRSLSAQHSMLDELSSYLDNVARVVGANLAFMDPSISHGDLGTAMVSRADAVANRYESENASDLEMVR